MLIVGSGNVVHNLGAYAWGQEGTARFDWASRFETVVKHLILAEDSGPLINTETLGQDAMLSIPTPEHYLPLLYVLGARQAGETATFPIGGIDGRSLSMLSVRIG